MLYSPWLFLGYGSDEDSYRIVRTGRVLLEEGQYIGSRNPGYLVPELATTVLNALGGSVLSNLGTLCMALVALAAFLTIAERLRLASPLLIAAGLALHPVFWSNAAATMDHIWGLGFLLAGWAVLLDRRWLWAGLLLGLAVGSRFTTLLAVLGVVAFAWGTTADDRRCVFRSALLAAGVGAVCYLPSAYEFGWTLGFLAPAGLGGPELWTWPLRLGRWGYKSLYFWGIPTAAFLAGLGVVAWRQRPLPRPALLALCLAVPVAYEALFLRFPLDPGYLLPIAPFVLIAVGVLLAEHRRWLVAFVVVLALYNVVTINLARPDKPFQASDAAFGLWAEPGPLIVDTQIRMLTRDCADVACWRHRMGLPE